MAKDVVISLFDYTGVMVEPWAEAGYECHCYDIQHVGDTVVNNIHYHAAAEGPCPTMLTKCGRKITCVS